MKERPVLFSGEMVKAILDGRKTQTRRILKPFGKYEIVYDSPENWQEEYDQTGDEKLIPILNGKLGSCPVFVNTHLCPFGVPGDRLWVREAFQPLWVKDRPGNYKTGDGYKVSYPATDGIQEYMTSDDEWTDRITPSIHMPRWASRITLEITGVRVERLQDISEKDAAAEGCCTGRCSECSEDWPELELPKHHFEHLWESINGEGSWAKNPWVWVIEFRKL